MAQDTELSGHVVSGRYRLVRRVGESVPALYEARHPRLAGRFSARLWPPTAPWDAFRGGAEVAATLRHPGVLQVIDFNCEPGAPPFLVTEWMEGTKLSDLMAASGLLAVSRVATLVESTAWALAAAHQQGVVHQELRPEEILVVQTAGSAREWTKVDGFGIAAALARAGARPPSPYRAPEQAAGGDDEADPQSDQYALAAIAYEMLAGVRPESGPEGGEGPTPLSELAPGVSGAVDIVIRQALEPVPEERFPGVLEFARALRDAAEGVSTQVVRRRKLEAQAKARAKTPGDEPVSPFFNPVDTAPVEGLRPGRLLGWRGRLVRMFPRLPGGVPARIGIALGALMLLVFGAAALAIRLPPKRATPRPEAATVANRAPPVVAPAAQPAGPPTPAVRRVPRVAPQVEPIAEPLAPADPAPPPVLAIKKSHASRSAPRTPPAPAPRPPAAAAAPAPPPRPAAAGGSTCAISVSSKPWAHLWIDERNTGRRTPVSELQVPCGDHKLILKRDDLDIYQMETITVRPGTPFKKSYPLQ